MAPAARAAQITLASDVYTFSFIAPYLATAEREEEEQGSREDSRRPR